MSTSTSRPQFLQNHQYSRFSNMAPLKLFETVFHLDKDYIVIPRSFFRHWGQELEPEVHLKDDRRLNLQCRVEPALGDKAHFFTNTSAIKQHYQIDQPAIMKIKYVRRQTFRFSFPSHNPSRRSFQRRSYSPQDFDSEPIWSLHISRSMATARQTLQFPANVVHTLFRERPSSIKVLLHDQHLETWNILWYPSRLGQCNIGIGWYEFVESYPLRAGDVVKFWKSKDGRILRLTVNDD